MERATLLATVAVLMLVPAAAASTASHLEMFPPPRTDEFPNRVATEVSKAEPPEVVPSHEASDAGPDRARAAADGAEVLRRWAERLKGPPSRAPAPPATPVVAAPGAGEGRLE
jgi:hypothetical protein